MPVLNYKPLSPQNRILVPPKDSFQNIRPANPCPRLELLSLDLTSLFFFLVHTTSKFVLLAALNLLVKYCNRVDYGVFTKASHHVITEALGFLMTLLHLEGQCTAPHGWDLRLNSKKMNVLLN